MEAQRQKFSCPLDITTWMHSHHLNWMTPKLKTTPSFPLSLFFNKRHINLACPNHNPETPLFLLAYYVYMNCPWLFNSSTSHSFLFAHFISATSDSFYCGSTPQSLCISYSFCLELHFLTFIFKLNYRNTIIFEKTWKCTSINND